MREVAPSGIKGDALHQLPASRLGPTRQALACGAAGRTLAHGKATENDEEVGLATLYGEIREPTRDYKCP
jgi:hypothetical protein